MDKKTHTKGNVIVEDIKIGDIHYEFNYGVYIKTKVVDLPVAKQEEDGSTYWKWNSVVLNDKGEETGKFIEYGVNDKYSHYGPNIYDYHAYVGGKQIF
jgi:hypothetical protein